MAENPHVAQEAPNLGSKRLTDTNGPRILTATSICACRFPTLHACALCFACSQPSDGITRVTETEKNNSGLHDDNSNQRLTQADIQALKEAGKGGNAIVDALCSNSATFSAKTEFAQDKYKKKKAKKYCTYITLRKPTARSICQVCTVFL